MAEEIRIDRLLVDGAQHLAKQMGAGKLWDSGLGALVEVAVDSSAVPRDAMSASQIRDRLGVTPNGEKALRAAGGLLGELLRGSRG